MFFLFHAKLVSLFQHKK